MNEHSDKSSPVSPARRRILKRGGQLVTVTLLASSAFPIGCAQQRGGAANTAGTQQRNVAGNVTQQQGGGGRQQGTQPGGGGTRPANAVDPNSQLAQALNYVEDAANAENRTNADAFCYNCRYYMGTQADDWAPCQIFMSQMVPADGWCSSWVQQEA